MPNKPIKKQKTAQYKFIAVVEITIRSTLPRTAAIQQFMAETKYRFSSTPQVKVIATELPGEYS